MVGPEVWQTNGLMCFLQINLVSISLGVQKLHYQKATYFVQMLVLKDV